MQIFIIMNYIDFHSHVLPGADHGSDSVETSLVQLKMAEAAGVGTIVATPHFYPHKHSVDGFLKRREVSYRNIADKYHGKINIILGAEVLLCDNINKLPFLEKLCISGTKTILIELPFTSFKQSYVDMVEALINDGYRVVLAHPERYEARDIESMISVGAVLQLNSTAFGKIFINKYVGSWLDRDLVYALGSDIHLLKKKYYKSFARAVKRIRSIDSIMKKSKTLISG